MRNKNTKRSILLLMALFFMLPSFLAYMVFIHPDWFHLQKKNKGELLWPVVQVDTIKPNHKWRLVLVVDSTCEQDCLETLDKLKRVRMSLGKDMYRTHQVLLTSDVVDSKKRLFFSNIEGLDTRAQRVSAATLSHFSQAKKLPAIFIADPNANIIMAYEQKALPDDIYQDMKHLLNASKVG